MKKHFGHISTVCKFGMRMLKKRTFSDILQKVKIYSFANFKIPKKSKI